LFWTITTCATRKKSKSKEKEKNKNKTASKKLSLFFFGEFLHYGIKIF